ncbi:MAG: CarD family transcriptional regulator [Vulcanimicrobiota bacterium]
MIETGSKVFHSLHGVGTVISIEEKVVLGQPTTFSVSSFGDDGLKIMVNLNKQEKMIRPIIEQDEIPKVMDYLQSWDSDLPSKAPTRYSMNLGKLKSGDIYALCEVIKGLTALSETRKLSPKDQVMLEQTRKNLAQELGLVREASIEEMEEIIDRACRQTSQN